MELKILLSLHPFRIILCIAFFCAIIPMNRAVCQELDSLDIKYGMGYRDYLEPMDSIVVNDVLGIALIGNCDTIVGFLRRDDGVGEPNGFNGFSGIMKFYLARQLINCKYCIRELIENSYVYGSSFSIDSKAIESNNRPVYYALTCDVETLNVLKHFILESDYLIVRERKVNVLEKLARAKLFFLILNQISDEEYSSLKENRRVYLKRIFTEEASVLRKIKK